MIQRLIALFTETNDHFQGKEEGERIILIARKHIFTLVSPSILIFLAALVPLLVKLAFPTHIDSLGLEDWFLCLSSIWYSLLWVAGFYTLMLYSLNTIIVTDRRMIENEQLGFFNRKVSELPLFRIQDISVETAGFFETLLSFGTITIQTAAEKREFVFDHLPQPEEVKNIVMQATGIHRSRLNLN